MVHKHDIQAVKFVLVTRLFFVVLTKAVVKQPTKHGNERKNYSEPDEERHLLINIEVGSLVPEKV